MCDFSAIERDWTELGGRKSAKDIKAMGWQGFSVRFGQGGWWNGATVPH
jgi:hypothetical protein